MENKQKGQDTEYKYREDNTPHRQTGNINERNNNESNEEITAQEPNVERANDAGIGDSAVNDQKLTKYPSNRSADA